jgi:DNA-binding transcriptional ArsR family regulator
MHTTIFAAFLEISRTAVSMCSAGILLFLVALWAAKTDIPRAGGLDKIVVLSNLCFAIPLAVFGAEHLSGARFIMLAVPSYMPWRLFWAYFVGFALLSASLSIATKIQVRWSGLLFGIMMFLFVAMVHIPRVLANPKDRFAWVIVIREMSLYTLTRICSVEYIKRVESVFEIIAEPNRRAILSLLVSSQQSVGEIERQLRMPQPTVSKHLRVLREAGFVESTVDAQRRLYRLKPEPFQEVDAWLAPFRRFWSAHVDALERHLDRMDQSTNEKGRQGEKTTRPKPRT